MIHVFLDAIEISNIWWLLFFPLKCWMSKFLTFFFFFSEQNRKAYPAFEDRKWGDLKCRWSDWKTWWRNKHKTKCRPEEWQLTLKTGECRDESKKLTWKHWLTLQTHISHPNTILIPLFDFLFYSILTDLQLTITVQHHLSFLIPIHSDFCTSFCPTSISSFSLYSASALTNTCSKIKLN